MYRLLELILSVELEAHWHVLCTVRWEAEAVSLAKQQIGLSE